MKAIILAAGRGSRMRDLTEERPKCLVELCGKTLLDWQLEALRLAGVAEIAIVTGYRRELLTDRGLVEFHNARWAETNMVSSLACAQDWLRAEPCIVSYSDIFYAASAPRLLMKAQAELTITYDPNWQALWESRFEDPLSDAETFKISATGLLLEIGQRPIKIDDIQGQYMGLLKFTPAAWHRVEVLRQVLETPVLDRLDMTEMLQRLIADQGALIQALANEDMWGEVDSAEDLAVYESKSWKA